MDSKHNRKWQGIRIPLQGLYQSLKRVMLFASISTFMVVRFFGSKILKSKGEDIACYLGLFHLILWGGGECKELAIMVFQWVSAHISGFNIGAPIEYAHSILHVSDTSNPWKNCPKRGLRTTGGQIPIKKHCRSFQTMLPYFLAEKWNWELFSHMPFVTMGALACCTQ